MAHIDHIVLWVEDPLRSIEFYTSVVGLAPVRVVEFREAFYFGDPDGNVLEARWYA